MMKKLVIVTLISIAATNLFAQTTTDTTAGGASVIIKDSRIAVLEEKLLSRNDAIEKANSNTVKLGNTVATKTTSSGIVLVPGYKLMVISTPDRDLAMRVRSQLYQNFNEKQQLIFQMPNSKIKFGNFLSRAAADQARKKILALKIVTNNIYIISEPDIYIISEPVEMKVEKVSDDEVEGLTKKDTKKETKKETKPTKPKK
jgi:hypothetical protein